MRRKEFRSNPKSRTTSLSLKMDLKSARQVKSKICLIMRVRMMIMLQHHLGSTNKLKVMTVVMVHYMMTKTIDILNSCLYSIPFIHLFK